MIELINTSSEKTDWSIADQLTVTKAIIELRGFVKRYAFSDDQTISNHVKKLTSIIDDIHVVQQSVMCGNTTKEEAYKLFKELADNASNVLKNFSHDNERKEL